ncbi:MAG: LysE family translocator [Alphaproteobacteria bacterium]|nr:LysE family translocator [Alphaproteobacteria bacterium]
MSVLPNPLIIPIGIFIGILVAAPVGPVNVLCIQRAIARGMWGGVAAGLGAVLGDGLIAFSAAMGVGAISGVVTYYRTAIQLVGGAVLIAFGWHLYLTVPTLDAPEVSGNGGKSVSSYLWDVPKTFFLTVTNPGAVLGLFAIFGGISTFVEVRGPVEALLMVAAVMVGSLSWWVGLSYVVGRMRGRLSLERMGLINRVAGLALVVFGAVLIGEIAINLLTGKMPDVAGIASLIWFAGG